MITIDKKCLEEDIDRFLTDILDNYGSSNVEDVLLILQTVRDAVNMDIKKVYEKLDI